MLVRVRRIGAAVALLAFAAGLLLPGSFVVHEPDDADAAWGAPGLVAGHPTTQLEPVLPSADEEHCAICHWMRALTHSVALVSAPEPDMQRIRLVLSPRPVSVQPDFSSPSPARAPPSLTT